MTERDPRIELALFVDALLAHGAPPDEIGKILVVLASRCFGEARAAEVFATAARHCTEEAEVDVRATRH